MAAASSAYSSGAVSRWNQGASSPYIARVVTAVVCSGPRPARSAKAAYAGDMIVLEHTIAVDRPPEAVFDYLADPAHYVEWQPAVERAELVGDAEPRPGSRIRV